MSSKCCKIIPNNNNDGLSVLKSCDNSCRAVQAAPKILQETKLICSRRLYATRSQTAQQSIRINFTYQLAWIVCDNRLRNRVPFQIPNAFSRHVPTLYAHFILHTADRRPHHLEANLAYHCHTAPPALDVTLIVRCLHGAKLQIRWNL